MFDISATFAAAAADASHGRYAARLTDTAARAQTFTLRDAARATASDAARDAAAAYDAAREAARWLSPEGMQAIADAMRAWGAMRKATIKARHLFRIGGAWRDEIRELLAARARAAVIDAMPLSPGDAAQSGIVYGIIASHVSRGNRGEKNAPLTADSVTPDDVWQYAAELAIRAGDTVNGMPTYGGMIRHHKSAAAMFRRDAFTRRAGYVTLSMDDADSVDYIDALTVSGYVHYRPDAAAPLDVDALAAEWDGRANGANVHAHRAALADMRAELADAKLTDADANVSRSNAWNDATITDASPDDAATMGNAVVLSLVHGATFADIREQFAATDATYERYARAAAKRRALNVATLTDADIWSAERDYRHECIGYAVMCRTCTYAAWIMYDAAVSRIERSRANRYADDMRAAYVDSGKSPAAYAAAPLAPATYVARQTNSDRVTVLAHRKLSRVRALAVIADAETRAAAVIADAGSDKAAIKSAKRRAKRIVSAAAANADEMRHNAGASA